MKKNINLLNNNLLNILKVLSGNIGAQGISILTMPVITRLYSPSDFGLFQEYLSILAIIGIVSCLRYESSILIPEKNKNAKDIFILSLIILIILVVIISFFVFINYFLKIVDFKYLFLLPLGTLLYGIFILLNDWNTRYKNFGILAKRKTFSILTGQLFKIIIGFISQVNALFLIIGDLIKHSVNIFIGGKKALPQIKKLKSVSKYDIIYAAKRYKDFPLFNAPASLLNTVSSQLPVLMLANFFNSSVVGFFALGTRALRTPMRLMGDSLSRVFFQKSAQVRHKDGDHSRVIIKAEYGLVAIGLLPFIVLATIGPNLFALVFGARWTEAGRYIQILAPYMFLQFTLSPLSRLVSILEKQKQALVINVFQLLIKIGSLVFGFLVFKTPFYTIMSYSVGNVISILIFAGYFFYVTETNFVLLLKKCSMPLLLNTTIFFIIIFLQTFIDNIYLKLLLVAVLSGLYYFILYKKDKSIKEIIYKVKE